MSRIVNRPILTPLSDPAAQALANLLPLLACGEAAAAIVFRRLSGQPAFDAEAIRALAAIEAEEHEHERILACLVDFLPAPQHEPEMRRAARRFQLSLHTRCPVEHLARIAAVDNGVCTILSRLTRPNGPLAADPDATATLRRIRFDEAGHVAVSRAIARRYAARRNLRDGAAAARQSLADLLALGWAAFEDLAVDPAALIRDVARLPNGLL